MLISMKLQKHCYLSWRCGVCPLPLVGSSEESGKHLFIILCIISQSIILITSFPQDSGEMGLSYHTGTYPVLGASYSYLSTLPVFPRLPACHLPCSARLQPNHDDRRRRGLEEAPARLQELSLSYWTFAVYRETLLVCFSIHLFILAMPCKLWDLNSLPGIEHAPPCIEAWSPGHGSPMLLSVVVIRTFVFLNRIFFNIIA